LTLTLTKTIALSFVIRKSTVRYCLHYLIRICNINVTNNGKYFVPLLFFLIKFAMTDEVYLKKLGDNICKKREAIGLSREQFAEKVKIARMHVYRIERGENPTTVIILRRIAKVLNVSLGDLVELK
jgi:DNA-binding XRE family transcriptional regulator